MEEIRIKLSALWVALMLTYLLGDVLRIFSGDFQAGEIEGHASHPGDVLGHGRAFCHSDCDGFSIPDAKAARESLGEHYRVRALFCNQPRWITGLSFGV